MRLKTAGSLALAGFVALAVLAGNPAPVAADPAPTVPAGEAGLAWQPCYGGLAECATLVVPRDHARPSGPTLALPVVRVPASGPARKGTLVVNPGGPGVSAADYALTASFVLPARITSRYDVVGLGPRGVTDRPCISAAAAQRWAATDPTPDTPRERRRLAERSRALGEDCADWPLLDHVRTTASAQDLDTLRVALGEQRLDYLGYSYGTLLGATYAGLHPQRVGRMVLDGAIDPRRSSQADLVFDQAAGFDHALARFTRDCLQRSGCPLPGPISRALRWLESFLNGLDAAPLPARSGPALDQSTALAGVVVALYDDATGWPALRAALRAARSGNGGPLRDLGRSFVINDPAFLSPYLAISCSDGPRTPGPQGMAELADRAAARARVPEIARYIVWGALPCSSWPVAGPAPGAITASGARPILVVGTRHDPATPWRGARGLADQLASGSLLTWEGDGHVAVGRRSRCIDAAVSAYLVSGVVPPDGTACPA